MIDYSHIESRQYTERFNEEDRLIRSNDYV